jgi:hypothetical protein
MSEERRLKPHWWEFNELVGTLRDKTVKKGHKICTALRARIQALTEQLAFDIPYFDDQEVLNYGLKSCLTL